MIFQIRTRREDLLLSSEEQEAVYTMRKALNGMKPDEAVDNIFEHVCTYKEQRRICSNGKKDEVFIKNLIEKLAKNWHLWYNDKAV